MPNQSVQFGIVREDLDAAMQGARKVVDVQDEQQRGQDGALRAAAPRRVAAAIQTGARSPEPVDVALPGRPPAILGSCL